MELSCDPPSRTKGRESNSVVALPSARAPPAASRARTSALRTDIDHSIDMEAGSRLGWAGDDDHALWRDRLGMAAGAAVGEGGFRVRGGGRQAMAGPAERLRRERPHRSAHPGRGVAGELRPAAVAVAPGAGGIARAPDGMRA